MRVFMGAGLVVIAASQAGAQGPPPARVGNDVITNAGVSVPDPYRWLEQLGTPEVDAWARAQDGFARSFTAAVPDRAALRRRLTEASEVVRFSPPVRGGRDYFYASFATTGGTTAIQAIWVRRGLDGDPRQVLDGAAFAARGEDIAAFRPSPDGRWMAYFAASRGSNWVEVRIRDMQSGRDLTDRLRGVNRGRSAMVWTGDGRLVYERFPEPSAGTERTAALGDESVWLHRPGDPQTADREVFAPLPGVAWSLGTTTTRDRRRLVVMAKRPDRAGNKVFLVPLDGGAPRTVIAGVEATFIYVGDGDGRLWFRTDAAAPLGRVVAIDPAQPEPGAWRELVPEADQPITNWLGVSVVGDNLLVGYLHDARHEVRVFGVDGRLRYALTLPRPNGSLWTGFVGTQDDDEAFYTLSGVVDPGTVYRLDVRTGVSTEFQRPTLSWNPDDFVTEQVFYSARDGTRIPMFVVRRRDLDRTRPAPAFMYGYAYDWAAAPWYQPQIVVWLERGGIWALPNIRGGTEYGEAWNAAGSRHAKPTAINDYVDAARWLVAEGYTAPRLMVANASSAGGPVAAAAVLQAPEAFGALVLDYPLLDMLRYDRFTGARAWTHEYGTAADADDFRVLRAYSPVHTVRPGVCYPATLISPGERDETTPPLHAYKFVAALQAGQSCDHAILLRVSWGAGHASGATPADAADTWADQLAFLERVLPLSPGGAAGARPTRLR